MVFFTRDESISTTPLTTLISTRSVGSNPPGIDRPEGGHISQRERSLPSQQSVMYYMLKRVMLYFKYYVCNNIYIFAFRHVYPLVTHSSALWVQADSRQAFGTYEQLQARECPKYAGPTFPKT